MTSPYSRPDGVHDHGGAELRLHEHVEEVLLRVLDLHGYERVRLATVDYRDLYRPDRIGYDLYHHLVLGRLAESRDFPGEGAVEPTNDIVLRPDFTTPAARRWAELVLAAGGAPREAPFRWSYAGQAFRDWPPRQLRLREFRQVGVELLGALGPAADGEVLALSVAAIEALGLRAWSLHLGHAGLYRALLLGQGVPEPHLRAVGNGIAWLARVHLAARADAASFQRFLPGARNRLRDLWASRVRRGLPAEEVPDLSVEDARGWLVASSRAFLEAEWSAAGAGDPAGIARLAEPASSVAELLARAPAGAAGAQGDELAECLAVAGQPAATLSPAASRGLAYYTGVTWEIHSAAIPTTDTDVAGGGRYAALTRWVLDRALGTEGRTLSGTLDDEATGGVGVAFGVERLAAACRAEGRVPPDERAGVYVAVQGAGLLGPARDLAGKLRSAGIATRVELPRRDGMRTLSEQYGSAAHGGDRWVLLLAPEEWARGRVRVRELETRQELELPWEEALQVLGGGGR